MKITGLGPHGERAANPYRLQLTASDILAAKSSTFRVAIVLHTLSGDWSEQQLSGIVGTLGDCSIAVTEVIDCGFHSERQAQELTRLIKERPDAVISIPVGNVAVADAHKQISEAGIKLILLDNVPTGLLPGSDYVSLVSADNFGLGRVAAELLSPHITEGGEVGIIAYDVDFFATNEREIAFAKWMASERPDLSILTTKFSSIETAAKSAHELVAKHPSLQGLFVVWDIPAMKVLTALEEAGLGIPITTIDLGLEAATNLATGGPIVGIGAQNPFAQGVAVAQITILSLLGRHTPDWVALPGVSVTKRNVVESFQAVWRTPAPAQIIAASMPSDS